MHFQTKCPVANPGRPTPMPAAGPNGNETPVSTTCGFLTSANFTERPDGVNTG